MSKEGDTSLFASLLKEWNDIIGIPEEPEDEGLGQRTRFGNGLGVKTEREEQMEEGRGHSSLCPINLGHGMSSKVDQVNERPVEDSLLED